MSSCSMLQPQEAVYEFAQYAGRKQNAFEMVLIQRLRLIITVFVIRGHLPSAESFRTPEINS